MLVDQGNVMGRAIWFFIYAHEADIHIIRCHAILHVELYLNMAKCRDRTLVTIVAERCCILLWRGEVLLTLLYIRCESSKLYSG